MTFLENLNWRYAAKSFKENSKISKESLEKIKKAIRLAPTSFGVQPFHVVIILDKNILQKLEKHSPNNEKKLQTCSHLLVFCSLTDVKKRFNEIEKMKGQEKGLWNKIGIMYQYFSPLFSLIYFKRFFTKNAWAVHQAYLALGFTLAACTELKIDSCPLEGFSSLGYRQVLSIPNNLKPVVLLAIGERDENDSALKYSKLRFSENDLFTTI